MKGLAADLTRCFPFSDPTLSAKNLRTLEFGAKHLTFVLISTLRLVQFVGSMGRAVPRLLRDASMPYIVQEGAER